MAQRKPIVIDGEVREVPAWALVRDVVTPETKSIVTHSGELIPRERFSQVAVPDGFATNLAAINKGADNEGAEYSAPNSSSSAATRADMADCVRNNFSAARVTDFSVATQ